MTYEMKLLEHTYGHGRRTYKFIGRGHDDYACVLNIDNNTIYRLDPEGPKLTEKQLKYAVETHRYCSYTLDVNHRTISFSIYPEICGSKVEYNLIICNVDIQRLDPSQRLERENARLRKQLHSGGSDSDYRC